MASMDFAREQIRQLREGLGLAEARERQERDNHQRLFQEMTSTGSGINFSNPFGAISTGMVRDSVWTNTIDRTMVRPQDIRGEFEINFDTGGTRETRVKEAPLPEAKQLVDVVVEDITGGAPDSYVQMCTRLGYWPDKLLDKVLTNFCRTFMRKNEFAVYDEEAVNRYLNSRCRHAEFEAHTRGERGMFGNPMEYRFEYKPLRTQDALQDALGGRALFKEVVPEEALAVMQKVEEAWTEQTKDTPMKAVTACFEATEIYKDPDPFLRVTFKRKASDVQASFVIAHWDEPGFNVTK